MKAKLHEIRWHDKDAIYSVDFQAVEPDAPTVHAHAGSHHKQGIAGAWEPRKEPQKEKTWRLATAGADFNVRIWLVRPSTTVTTAPAATGPSSSKTVAPASNVEYQATLSRHSMTVNVVRFAPPGNGVVKVSMLASAGDDGSIIFWVPAASAVATFGTSSVDAAYEKEHWQCKSVCRNSTAREIYDLAWSPDGTKVIAGSMDFQVNIWDVSTSRHLHVIVEHTHFVQGVAWDPWGQFIATQSSDRSMHIYSVDSNALGLQTHAVGKNSRMEITRKAAQADAAALATAKAVVPSKSTSPKEKGKQVERLPIASTSTATNVFPSTHDSALDDSESEHLNSMDPPAPRAASSRRSSASGSQPPSLTNATSRSPSNLSAHPSHTFGRGLRSPSPAPLPAVHLPLSPKISSVVDSSNIASLPVKQVKKTHNVKLYSDQDSTPFFRRLCWSTDGSLLLTPAGLWEDPYAVVNANFGGGLGAEGGEPRKKKGVPVKESTKDRPKPTVYIYSRANIARPPIAHLPGHQKTSIAIRFSPVLWNLREGVVGENEEKDEENVVRVDLVGEGVEVKLPGSVEEAGGKEGEKRKPASLFDLPYRMVYAVATLDTVYLYDTQQSGPICMFGNIHLLPFTDLAWSLDGQTLIVSSADGYCSIITFDDLELGTPYPHSLDALPPPNGLPVQHASSATTASSVKAGLTAYFTPAAPVVDAPKAPKRAALTTTPAASSSSKGKAVEEITIEDSSQEIVEPVKKKPKRAVLTSMGPPAGSIAPPAPAPAPAP